MRECSFTPFWRFRITVMLCALALMRGIALGEKLTLEESVKIALEQNPAVRLAQEGVRKADAMIAEAVARGMPKVTAEGTYQRIDKVPEVSFGESAIKLGSLDSRTANVVLVQPLDISGAIRTVRKAAASGKSAYEHGAKRQANDIALGVKEAFFGVLRAEKLLEVQEERLAALEAHLKDAQARYEAGATAKYEVLRAETEMANARQEHIAAVNGVELAKAVFNNVLGREPDSQVDLLAPPVPEPIEIDLPQCIDLALRDRPEVQQARMFLSMNERMTDAAKLGGKPTANLRWIYNRNFDTSVFNPRESSWTAFLTLSVPVFDGGATRAAVRQAESDANSAKLTLEQVSNGVVLEVKQSYLSLVESKERMNAASKGLEQAKESMRLAEVRYKSGVSTQVEVLDARTALTLAETNYLNAVYDYQVALAKLERAVGGPEKIAGLVKKKS